MTILFLVGFCFVVEGAELKVSQNVSKQDLGTFGGVNLPYWSEETQRYFTRTDSKLTIDNFAYVVDYDLFKGYVVIYSSRVEPVSFVDVFSGNWKKTTLRKGYNHFNFSNLGEYSGLRILTIGSPTGFALLKQKRDPFWFENYPVVILKRELAEFSWQRALNASSLMFVGLAFAYYLRKELLESNVIRLAIYVILPISAVLIVLGLKYDYVDVQIVQGNMTTVKSIPALTFDKYQIKDMWNWYYGLFLLAGYMLGLKFAKPDQLTVIRPLMDKITIARYSFNRRRKIIRDENGRLCTVEIQHEGKLKVEDDGFEEEAYIEIDRRVKERSLREQAINKTALAVIIAGIFGFAVVADYFNVFRIDLASALIISAFLGILLNITVLKDRLTNIAADIMIISTKLIDNASYARDLANQRLIEMSKKYNQLIDELVKAQYEMKVEVTKRLLNLADLLEIQPAGEGGSGGIEHGEEDQGKRD
ncbi:hypothetical protein [Archaeoglobus sp. JdFR-39]|uniref:hypothetical protein n=1 Tax=Archaeoglobus sp. JdFR-39 TaxID=1934996 RepID=UPI0025BA9F6B|nr:hypothetical protein [Archaeoglobus sp. JdFR-39]